MRPHRHFGVLPQREQPEIERAIEPHSRCFVVEKREQDAQQVARETAGRPVDAASQATAGTGALVAAAVGAGMCVSSAAASIPLLSQKGGGYDGIVCGGRIPCTHRCTHVARIWGNPDLYDALG